MQLSDRMRELMKYIQNLNPNARHRITVHCRGNQPWEIEEHSTKEKIDLKPQNAAK